MGGLREEGLVRLVIWNWVSRGNCAIEILPNPLRNVCNKDLVYAAFYPLQYTPSTIMEAKQRRP